MSVIWVAITAMIVGGLLITVLSFIPKSEQQCAHCLDQCKESMSLTAKYSKDREYNICVLKKGHGGYHTAADGKRYK